MVCVMLHTVPSRLNDPHLDGQGDITVWASGAQLHRTTTPPTCSRKCQGSLLCRQVADMLRTPYPTIACSLIAQQTVLSRGFLSDSSFRVLMALAVVPVGSLARNALLGCGETDLSFLATWAEPFADLVPLQSHLSMCAAPCKRCSNHLVPNVVCHSAGPGNK